MDLTSSSPFSCHLPSMTSNRLLLLVALFIPWNAGFALAAEPVLEKIDLFEAEQDGCAPFRNPGIVVTAKGTTLAYCEAGLNSGSDWGTIDIMLRRSTDGGKTWQPRAKIANVPGPKEKNPVALVK